MPSLRGRDRNLIKETLDALARHHRVGEWMLAQRLGTIPHLLQYFRRSWAGTWRDWAWSVKNYAQTYASDPRKFRLGMFEGRELLIHQADQPDPFR